MAHGPHYKAVEFFETPALLITFIALGKLLEGAAKGRTSKVGFSLSAQAICVSKLLPYPRLSAAITEIRFGCFQGHM